MTWLKRQLLFKMFSSAKFAVPLLLIIAAVIAIGTLVESRYNATYAQMLVYNAWWFQALLACLGMSVFLAALSRWPWKSRHIGFLVTHLGILTLLAGGVVTRLYGIDGQLQIVEGQTGRQVFLSEKVFEYAGPSDFIKTLVPAAPRAWQGSGFGRINQKSNAAYRVVAYEPFVDRKNQTGPRRRDGQYIQFRLQSPFFDQVEWLHSIERPELQMGPAIIRLVTGELTSRSKPKALKSKAVQAPQLILRDLQSGEVLRRLTLKEALNGIQVRQTEIKVKRVLKRAIVSDNKVEEGEETSGGPNPALEIELKVSGKTYRDVVFARFPTFSLLPDNPTDFKIEYLDTAQDSSESAEPKDAAVGNLIEFSLADSSNKKVTVQLSKQGQQVLQQTVAVGEVISTPWMGMKVSIASTQMPDPDTESDQSVKPIKPKAKMNTLPPSAIQVSDREGKESFWLIEGEVKNKVVDGEAHQFYYGMNSLPLPFSLKLLKFSKVDYPGTELAMSFSSNVEVVNSSVEHLISMNEPLKQDGYTLYQSSYDLQPGRPALSIFSVNRDPGRWIKYLGSLIMAIGIIIFTVMRSRVYNKKAVKP